MLAQRWLYHEARGQGEAADMMGEREEKGRMGGWEQTRGAGSQEMDVKMGQPGREGGLKYNNRERRGIEERHIKREVDPKQLLKCLNSV